MKFTVKGKGPAVVFLHGHMFKKEMWDTFINDLKDDYTCIAIDLYGHGESDTPIENLTMPYQAKGVKEVLDELSITEATFVGHSMGGYVSLAFAKAYPDFINGLCLFYSKPQADSKEKKANREDAIKTIKANRQDFIRHTIRSLFNANALKANEGNIALAREWALSNTNEGIIASIKGMASREDLTSMFQNLNIPVEVILGAYDVAVDKEDVLPIIPDKKNFTAVVLTTGHMGSLEAPEESLSMVQQFLKKVNF